MKQFRLAISALCLLFLAGTQEVSAQSTAYKCSSANIKFTPGTAPAGSTYNTYLWKLDGTTLVDGTNGVVIDATTGELRIPGTSSLLNTTANTATTKTITLQVSQSGEGCLSTEVEYEVVILPTPAVAIDNGAITNYCADNPTATSLTANTTAITGLPANVGMTFEWTAGGSSVGTGTITGPNTGAWTSVLDYTSPSTTTPVEYEVVASYILPGGASLVGSCSSTPANATVQSYATPSTPAISVGGY